MSAALLERLAQPEPLLSVELRPPRQALDPAESMDAWIDLNRSVRRLVAKDAFVFWTDDAVGSREEENLQHLEANLAGEVDFDRLVPFLTCKHSLEYCHLYAARAHARGIEALTVVGGDPDVGPPRCVPHGYRLRAILRERVPALALGGWANPHRDAAEQVGFLTAENAHADYFLTQVVSHHSVGRVEAFVREAEARSGIGGVFGVFYYRSANPDTLERLGEFFPVPAAELTREFDGGAAPEEVCARSVRALREAGARHVYVSNLGTRRAAERLERVRALL